MVDRTAAALLRSLRNRMTSVERRIARGTFQLPGRLSVNGQRVADWDDALAAGFYWGHDAANQPNPTADYRGPAHTWWTGLVQVFPASSGDKVKQYLARPNYVGTAAAAWEFVRHSTDGGLTWSRWYNVGFVEDWTDLRGYLASGVTYAADGASELAGIRARRIGQNTHLSLGNIVFASITTPTNGNAANHDILSGIPEKFRPEGGVMIGPGWNGRQWSGFIRPSGNVVLATLQPNVTDTTTATLTNEQLSGTAYYPSLY